jgi:hypothetical protein
MQMFKSLIVLSSILVSTLAFANSAPNPKITPGALCTPKSADFWKYDYPEQIARCDRNVGEEEKQQVADLYGGIPKTDWPKYEFDHLIPLCAGGANTADNLWPQPITEAHEKDKLEDEICTGMRNGSITQAEAVQKVHEWFLALLSR